MISNELIHQIYGERFLLYASGLAGSTFSDLLRRSSSIIVFTAQERDHQDLTVLFGVKLTAIVAESRKLDSFLGVAGAVVDLHLQLVPRGLLKVVQDVALCQGGALRCGPGGGVDGPILQGEGRDGAAAVVPAVQVELDPGGVDAGEEFLLFGVLRLCTGRGSTFECL